MSLISSLLRVLYAPYDYRAAKINTERINLAVIHIPDQIGDAMAIFPVIRSLERQQIGHLIVVSSTINHPVFAALSLHDTKLTVIRMPFQDRATLDEIKRVAKTIRQNYGIPDICIEAMRKKNRKTMLFISTLKARTNLQVVGLTLKCFSAACKIPSRMDQIYRAPVPISWAIMMREAGFPVVRPVFEFPLSEETLAEVRRETRPLGQYIAVNFEGSVAERTFSPATARRIVEILRREVDLPLVIVHGPQGGATAAELTAADERVHRLRLSPSIARSAAVIKDAVMTITPDTAILHIASAYNIPTLAIYANYKTRWAAMQDISETIVVGRDINHLDICEFSMALKSLLRRVNLRSG